MNKYCSRCVYGDEVPNIIFDSEGVCNYCRQIETMEKEYPIGSEGDLKLKQIVEDIRKSGKGKAYDCVVGVSGGCDSSFLLYKMKEFGLRPLAAHFDNTWNSAIATENIHLMLKGLNVDLFTIVVDNKEMDDLFRSFFKAGVLDLDTPSDIGLATTLYKAAEKYKIKYVIEGHSFRTEGISPLGWAYMDGKYIASIHQQFGTLPLKTFPNLWLTNFLKYILITRVKKVRPLYYIDYRKEEAKQLLSSKFGWQWYGGHHCENRFSTFCHTYNLPKRWDIDQRANGYSALVRSGQMSRDEGIKLLSKPPEFDPDLIEYLKKRLGFSDDEFTRLMNLPKKSYKDYQTYKQTFEKMKYFFWVMYKMNLVTKSFYLKYTKKHK
jgi:N-acetyl sugar amidotransferase